MSEKASSFTVFDLLFYYCFGVRFRAFYSLTGHYAKRLDPLKSKVSRLIQKETGSCFHGNEHFPLQPLIALGFTLLLF